MATLYTQAESNVRKTWFLMTVFFIMTILLGWGVSWYFNNQTILYVFVLFSIGMNILSYWYSDNIVLSIAGAVPADRTRYRDLYNVVENLCITAGMKMPRIYIIPDEAPNAFATGRDEDHAAIAVTTGLLEILERSELEGVIAHELSHIRNRDILLQTVVVVLVGFVTLLSDFFLRWSLWGGGGRDERSDGRLQLVTLLIGIVLALLAPLAATLIQLAISRKREFLADASGALLTRYPEGLASALRKIERTTRPLRHANRAMAHLYIANPLKGGKQGVSFWEKLFMTHPPTSKRIAALLGGDYRSYLSEEA